MINKRFQELLLNFHAVLMREISQKIKFLLCDTWSVISGKIPRLRLNSTQYVKGNICDQKQIETDRAWLINSCQLSGGNSIFRKWRLKIALACNKFVFKVREVSFQLIRLDKFPGFFKYVVFLHYLHVKCMKISS